MNQFKHLFLSAFLGLVIMPVYAQINRDVIPLNDSSWRFIRQDVANAQESGFDDAGWLPVSIPHDWNGGIDGVHDDVFTGPDMYLGIGWYRSEFFIPSSYDNKRIVIKFEAVSTKADVYLNNEYLGQHKGGYTAFQYDITDNVLVGDTNVLAVKASNANDSSIAPWMAEPFDKYPASSDYAVYGGIYRDVWLIVTDNIKIESHYHSTPNLSNEKGDVAMSTTIKNYATADIEVTLKSEIIDKQGNIISVLQDTLQIPAGNTDTCYQTTTIASPNLWAPSNPYLYKVRSTLVYNGQESDQIETPLGFRWYTLENNKAFVLNGQNSFLQGVNRHQDWQGVGYALSNDQHRHDVALIKELGFNFIRHAVYPADPAFVKACDENGVMLWLEIPVSTCVAENQGFVNSSLSQMAEMIQQSYNNPSVILWGIGNETDQVGSPKEASNAFTTNLLNQLNDLAHSLDTTRPTTGCNFKRTTNQNIVDIYSPQNWAGWYGSAPYTDYDPTSLIGEYGSSMHLPSHDETHEANSVTFPWTQEYGCKYHEYKASVGHSKKDEFPGHLIWLAFDCSSPRADRTTNPIPYMNQKGLFLHDHQTWKDVAYFYKSYYTKGTDDPMVYIVSETWTSRFNTSKNGNIWAYSNCDSVVLYNGVGGQTYGSRTRNAGPRNDTRFQWNNIEITNPVLYAEGYVNGTVAAKDTLLFLHADAGPDTLQACKYHEVEISGAIAQSYSGIKWLTFGDGIFDNDSILNPVYHPGMSDTASGFATVVLQVADKYHKTEISSDTMVLAFQDRPVRASAGNDTVICKGDTIVLMASGGDFYNWPSGGASAEKAVAPGSTTTYKVIVSNGICYDTAEVTITVNELPAVNLNDFPVVSEDTSAFNLDQGIPEGGIYSGPGITGNTLFDPALAGTGTHQITYMYTDTNSCSNSAAKEITVTEYPGVSINKHKHAGISIYPNPTYGEIIIKAKMDIKQIHIMDVLGIIRNEFNHAGQYLAINIANLENGIYFLQIITYNDERYVFTIVKT
jgi:beta-galactosidase